MQSEQQRARHRKQRRPPRRAKALGPSEPEPYPGGSPPVAGPCGQSWGRLNAERRPGPPARRKPQAGGCAQALRPETAARRTNHARCRPRPVKPPRSAIPWSGSDDRAAPWRCLPGPGWRRSSWRRTRGCKKMRDRAHDAVTRVPCLHRRKAPAAAVIQADLVQSIIQCGTFRLRPAPVARGRADTRVPHQEANTRQIGPIFH